MQIENLIQIVDNDIKTLSDKSNVVLEYVKSVDGFVELVNRYCEEVNWVISEYLQQLFGTNNRIIKKSGAYTWKILGSVSVSAHERVYIFKQSAKPDILIDYQILTEATLAKPECLCRILIERSGERSFFDLIVRPKNLSILLQAINYKNFLEKLFKNGLSHEERYNLPPTTNGMINIKEYQTIKKHQEIMTDILQKNTVEVNEFKIIYRGDEYLGNQETFQILFEKILDSASCLK